MLNIKSIIFAIAVLGSVFVNAQTPEKVSLVQKPGVFTTTELTLKAGRPYVFEVENDGVDRKVGFVIAPKGKTDQSNHIASAYLKEAIVDGETALSGEVTLEAGEYVYFCPLNPTPLYSITVE